MIESNNESKHQEGRLCGSRSLSRRFRPIFGLPDVFRTSSKAGPDWPSKADPVLLKLEGVLSPLPSAFNKTGVLSLLRLLFLN